MKLQHASGAEKDAGASVTHAPVLENCRGWSIAQWCGCSKRQGKSLKMSVVKAFNSLPVAGWMTTTQIYDIRHGLAGVVGRLNNLLKHFRFTWPVLMG